MKQFLFLLIASILVSLACYGLFHFIFSVNRQDSLFYSFSAGIAGLVGEYVRIFLSAQKKKKNSLLQ